MLTQLSTTQIAVGVHQLGNHADLQLLQIGLSDIFLRVACLQLALNAPEQIDLPGHVEAQIVALDIDPVGGLTRHLGLADTAAGAASDYRQVVVGHVVTNGPGRLEAGKGHAQITVALQRLGHQRAERRIIELLPPDVFEMRAIITMGAAGVVGSHDISGRCVRRFVIRADGAGRQGQYQQARGKEFQGTHQCFSSASARKFSALVALRAWARST